MMRFSLGALFDADQEDRNRGTLTDRNPYQQVTAADRARGEARERPRTV